jgi:hypothetical protein
VRQVYVSHRARNFIITYTEHTLHIKHYTKKSQPPKYILEEELLWDESEIMEELKPQERVQTWICIGQWFPNGVSRHPGVSGGTTRCVAKLKKNI